MLAERILHGSTVSAAHRKIVFESTDSWCAWQWQQKLIPFCYNEEKNVWQQSKPLPVVIGAVTCSMSSVFDQSVVFGVCEGSCLQCPLCSK